MRCEMNEKRGQRANFWNNLIGRRQNSRMLVELAPRRWFVYLRIRNQSNFNLVCYLVQIKVRNRTRRACTQSCRRKYQVVQRNEVFFPRSHFFVWLRYYSEWNSSSSRSPGYIANLDFFEKMSFFNNGTLFWDATIGSRIQWGLFRSQTRKKANGPWFTSSKRSEKNSDRLTRIDPCLSRLVMVIWTPKRPAFWARLSARRCAREEMYWGIL